MSADPFAAVPFVPSDLCPYALVVVDSAVFLYLAFGSLAYLPGQVVGKAWAVLLSVPFVRLLRRVAPTPA